ncbi:MAG TPA: ABC transporter permease [Anaerolineales bacterium]|nr:ABC transporter permease [Anaerolineales bacterium]
MNSVTSKVEENWQIVLEPGQNWFWQQLKETWQYRDLIYFFVRRDFVANYQQTILGPAWFIIQPLLSTLVFTVVFGRIANLSTDGTPTFLFYMIGNITWGLFSSVASSTANLFISNSSVFSKVYFPRLTVPIANTFSKLITFAIQFLTFLALVGYAYFLGAKFQFTPIAFLLPLLLFLSCCCGLGLGFILAALTVKYRDLAPLFGFMLQLMMYLSTVIFPISKLPEKYSWIIISNPMSAIIETVRYGFLGKGLVLPTHLLYSTGITIVLLILGLIAYNRVEKTFVDII